MLVDSLKIRHFRNLANISLNFDAKLNCIIGNNGQGKTNLLEALSLSLSGSSFRGAKPDQMLSENTDSGQISTIVQSQLGKSNISCLLSKQSLRYFRGEKKITKSQLKADYPIIIFSPDSLASIKAGPESRRTLVDEIGCQICDDYLAILTSYTRTLRQRNRLLKNFKEDVTNFQENQKLLKALNPIFLDHGAQLSSRRLDVLQVLEPEIRQALRFLFRDDDLDFHVQYNMSGQDIRQLTIAEILDCLSRRAEDLAIAEQQLGNSLVGPHKHDISFELNQKNSRYFASQGQQRAVIIAILIGQIRAVIKERGRIPILLLDDVLSELDVNRREYLVEYLNSYGNQIIMTSTELDLHIQSHLAKKQVIAIANGQIAIS